MPNTIQFTVLCDDGKEIEVFADSEMDAMDFARELGEKPVEAVECPQVTE